MSLFWPMIAVPVRICIYAWTVDVYLHDTAKIITHCHVCMLLKEGAVFSAQS